MCIRDRLWYLATNLILMESNGHSVTYGRFDRIMGPFYEHDIKAGTLTRELMQELIECSFIKMDHLRKIRNYGETVIASGIGWGGTALNVGGIDENGNAIFKTAVPCGASLLSLIHISRGLGRWQQRFRSPCRR